MSVRIPVSLACWDYDRTSALADGSVRPDGVDLTYLSMPIEETFFRMLRHREFDAAEMSLSSYVVSLTQDAPFIAIPVFPSRAFRHNGIYVNTSAGIDHPGDLAGRTVGVPEYQLTACVWIRGLLSDHYGVPAESVRYRTGGLHTPGRSEKVRLNLPPEIQVQPIAEDTTLTEMLLTGEIDALYSPRIPRPFVDGDPNVRRLFADPRPAEEAYFGETGIFPIMHTIVLRRDFYVRHPWVARSLYTAFERAKRRTEARLEETAASLYMLPWLYQEVERLYGLMGRSFWPYGLPANSRTLQVFLRYAQTQGLTERLLEPTELFAPETLEEYVI